MGFGKCKLSVAFTVYQKNILNQFSGVKIVDSDIFSVGEPGLWH